MDSDMVGRKQHIAAYMLEMSIKILYHRVAGYRLL